MTTPTATTQFFGKTYDEAMTLLVAARDYVAHVQAAGGKDFAPQFRAVVHCETMRLTARLSQIMAWLLAQKAVHTGEITREMAAGEQFRLSGATVCTAETDVTIPDLPPRLRELLEQSRRLYVRVARLDDLVRRAQS